MTTYNIPKHDGFKHLNPKLSDYEKAVTGIFNERKLRQQDKDVENMQHSVVQFSKLKNLGQTNAKWDHKPVLKKHISSYFHKKLTNAKGKPATVFGTMIPGDKKYLYDHDIWSNIHFGYAGKLSNSWDVTIDVGSRLHDLKYGHFRAFLVLTRMRMRSVWECICSTSTEQI